MTSGTQAAGADVRVLEPTRRGIPRRFLLVLPVEPGRESRYGEGLEEVRKLGLHEKFGLTVVAPTFAKLPWYADHADDPTRRDETCLIRGILPWLDRQYPSEKPKRLLLGFSKSGWGALTLILRHPRLFDAAWAWDAPLMKAKPDRFGMGPAFGGQENFEKYQVTRLLRDHAGFFRNSTRLGLSGYGNFRKPMVKTHELLGELKIRCVFKDGPKRAHRWGSGWVEEAVTGLVSMVEGDDDR